MAAFKRLTAPQASVYRALRELGSIVVTPNDARPLRALQKRGLVVYRRDNTGTKTAVLREDKRTRNAARRHKANADRMWDLVSRANEDMLRANSAALTRLMADAQKALRKGVV